MKTKLLVSIFMALLCTNIAISHAGGIRGSSSGLNPPQITSSQIISTTQINFSWIDGSPETGYFRIERSPNGSSWTAIDSVAFNVLSYNSTGLTPKTLYYYRVNEVFGTASSPYSNVIAHYTMFQGPNPCEDFASLVFPPPTIREEHTGSSYWFRMPQSAYGNGAGSMMFNSYNAPAATVHTMFFHNLNPQPGTYLTFDNAYAPYLSGSFIDSLIIETSSNGGSTFTNLVRLWGGLGAQAGPLNTVFVGQNGFTPASFQWASKIYLLPNGTNTIKMKFVSGHGNNICLDNICLNVYPGSGGASVTLVPQGFFRTPPPQTVRDTVRIYLRRTDFPNIAVDSAISYLTTNGLATSPFTKALTGTYYLVVRHRNSLETWSKSGGESYTRGALFSYNLFLTQSNAYNSNLAQVDPFPYFGIYGGDITHDGVIDLSDIIMVFNDANAFVSGYVITDVTGDNFTDLSDIVLTFNNSAALVSVQKPPGGDQILNYKF